MGGIIVVTTCVSGALKPFNNPVRSDSCLCKVESISLIDEDIELDLRRERMRENSVKIDETLGPAASYFLP